MTKEINNYGQASFTPFLVLIVLSIIIISYALNI